MKVLFAVFCASLVLALAAKAEEVNHSSHTTHSSVFESIPPIISCDPGYVQYHDQCVKTKTETIYGKQVVRCPTGFELSADETICTLEDSHKVVIDSKVSVGPSPSCPFGYQYDGRECYKVDVDCPPGYYYNPADSLCWPHKRPDTVINPPPCGAGPYPCPHTYQVPYYPAPCTNQCASTNVPCTKQCPLTNVPCTNQCTSTNGPCTNQCTSQIVPVAASYHRDTITIPVPPTVQTCPPGFKSMGNKCERIDVLERTAEPIHECESGYYRDSKNVCVKYISKVEHSEPRRSCYPGYTFISGSCQLIKDFSAERVHNRTVVSPVTPIRAIEKDHHIFVNNTVYSPVNINNINNHTTIIHSTTDGWKETLVPAPMDDKDDKIIEEPIPDRKCCEVVSPRICRRRSNKSWGCFHRKTKQCGGFCTAPKIHIRPEQPIYRPRVIVMPPPLQPPCNHAPCTMHPQSNDCSSCYMGGSCPNYCNSYDCEATNSCAYVNQGSYCSEYGGRPCTQDFGCLDQDYCS